MSDLISRQAAIDTLDVLCQEHRYRIPGKAETYSSYNEAWQDALGRAENAIGNLPSVEPYWILCSERLPEDDRSKVVTLANGNSECGYYANGDWWCIGDSITLENPTVIAWMPLPKPYEVEEE